MGTSCPKCNHPVEGEFGLVNCSHCGTPVLIGLDGEPVAETPKPIATESMPPPDPEPESSFTEVAPDADVESDHAAWTDYAQEAQDLEVPMPEEAEPVETQFVESEFVAEEPPPFNPDDSEPVQIPAEPPPLNPAAEATNDLREIADFGNEERSEISDTHDLLDLVIQGIDTAEIRQSVIEAIEDKKLNIDLKSAVEGLQAGDMILREIAPLKCAIIVQRLKSLPVDLIWGHHEPS